MNTLTVVALIFAFGIALNLIIARLSHKGKSDVAEMIGVLSILVWVFVAIYFYAR